MTEQCEFEELVEDHQTGWETRFCRVEMNDPAFDATRDCIKRTCRIFNPAPLDFMIVRKKLP